MCKEYLTIKSKNYYGIKKNYIPCGKCSECRKAAKAEWTNRAKTEIQEYVMKRGYNAGFITLTYHDKSLPHIPRKFLKDKNEKIPCFNYEHIKKFIDRIRKHLFDKYKMTDGYRFLITSEYGEKKHRPHYHGLILFNKKINHMTMYQIVQDAWTGSTHQIKNNKKRHTKRYRLGMIGPYKSFVPKDTYSCGGYVAKYICKDIEFEENIKDKLVEMGKKWRNELRHYAPFHKQSMSFGKKITENRKDMDIMEMLKDGIDITGNAKKTKIPRYIHNKILYTTQKKYNLKTHKFETIKKYTKFFAEHKKEVYELKLERNRKMFEDMTNAKYFEIHQLHDRTTTKHANETIKKTYEKYGIDEIAYFYTTYYGTPYDRCRDERPEEILFNKYNPCADMEEKPKIDKNYYEQMTQAIDNIIGYSHITKTVKRTEQEEKDERIRSFWEQNRQ